jgi:nitroimidazol reductase NimA-like FMN-containing flavoprotein (pyridoxamine 5'-phosphate oxidase superfamily)
MRKKEREVTDIAELESIISRSDVCRVAFADKDVPYIVTMNFGYMHGEPGRNTMPDMENFPTGLKC